MLSDEHKTELDTRLGEYLEAKGTSYSWSQALKIIRSK
jgi:hypothetical protein